MVERIAYQVQQRFEQTIDDGPLLADQLVHARRGHRSAASRIHIHAVAVARWLAVDKHAVMHGCSR